MNLPALARVEVMLRKYQEIEEEIGKEEEDLSGSSTGLYRGRPKICGGMCVSPELQEWGAKKLERRVNRLKYHMKINDLRGTSATPGAKKKGKK